MISMTLLAAFIPTFFFVSITPGMCMTLAMSLGMTIGVRRTLWMMVGELAGVATVAIAAAVGVAAIMLRFPMLFVVLKIIGGTYLIYLGYSLWRSKGKLALTEQNAPHKKLGRRELMYQGFITAVANPKGWAFLVALLPPFISPDYPLLTQLPILILMILILEWMCLMIYSSGGQSLGALLKNTSNLKLMNRIAGSLMAGVGIWLMLS
ncbi:LysE family translocator [Gynuella sunshinyii]|uniref:Putative threonine efflux protein n=1 Tax=Gynuella sunshinyii YC6258 TaxID=1445510 RepID=A0A0C5VHT8_9GAMM|nr:LysE family translocator [Gynuella sunshinyii]AJQ92928.1 putative threonine efflux protein [Gynuella sunshinyii YC6258]